MDNHLNLLRKRRAFFQEQKSNLKLLLNRVLPGTDKYKLIVAMIAEIDAQIRLVNIEFDAVDGTSAGDAAADPTELAELREAIRRLREMNVDVGAVQEVFDRIVGILAEVAADMANNPVPPVAGV